MGKKIENIIGQLSIFDILGISESIEGFSSDDFGKAISKLQKAQSKAIEREENERRRKEKEEAERKAREEKARQDAHIQEVTCMDLPLDWNNVFNSDVSLGLSLQVNKNVVQAGNRIKIRIVKKNVCNLAFVNGSITIKYMYCHTGDEFMINVPIKQGIRKSAGITDISADYCGNICVGVESIDNSVINNGLTISMKNVSQHST